MNWLEQRLLKEGMIDPQDMLLLQLLDEPEDVIKAIFNHYEKSGLNPPKKNNKSCWIYNTELGFQDSG